MTKDQVLTEVQNELKIAMEVYPPFNTAHEGWAVIYEELDELWDEVKKNQRGGRNPVRLRREAVQVAAMAIRFAIECDGSK